MAEKSFPDPELPPRWPSADVVVIGGGLSGTLTAIMLGRKGFQVVLLDTHASYPPDFRAEQLVGYQLELLSGLGLFDLLAQDTIPAEQAVKIHKGRTASIVTSPHYGIDYEDMVGRARQGLPPSVRFLREQVGDIDLGKAYQRVHLSKGGHLDTRLVVLATGLGQRLLRQIGIEKTTIASAHSVVFGFDLRVTSANLFNNSVLVKHGGRPEDRIDYLTLFMIGQRLRANLFTYHAPRDGWMRNFMRQPQEMLQQSLPNLEAVVGRIEVVGAVQVRIIDLAVAANYCKHGVVLVGDAFQTSSPAAGTGISRLLNDIDRLCNVYIPRWLSTDGMSVHKISEFYDDPVKRRCDAEALRVAEYRRAVTVETGLLWKLHRQRVLLQNQVQDLLTRRMPWRQHGRFGRSVMDWWGPGMAVPPLYKGRQRTRKIV